MADADEPSLPHFETLSTSRAPDDGVIDYWREARRHAYVDVSTDPADPDFYGDVRLGRYTNFTLSTKRATAEQTHRNRSRIAQGREQDEYLFATFQTRGSCVIEQAGHTAVVPPGSMVIYDSSLPFAFRADAPYEQVIVKVPADRAFALAGIDRTTDILATTMSCAGAMSAVAAFFTQLAQTPRQRSPRRRTARDSRLFTGHITTESRHTGSLCRRNTRLPTTRSGSGLHPCPPCRPRPRRRTHRHRDATLPPQPLPPVPGNRPHSHGISPRSAHPVRPAPTTKIPFPARLPHRSTNRILRPPHLLPSVPRHHRHDTQRTPRTPRLTTHCTYPLYSSTRPPDGSTTTGSGESWPAYDRWPET